MKLLFDQNLSHKLIELLSDLYPGSQHVRALSLRDADDDAIWRYAKSEGFVIATKDEDFYALSLLYGFPPKVLWIRSGNCATELVETLLRRNHGEVSRFESQAEAGFLRLW